MWGTRTLQRNVSSQYYHRLLKSQNKLNHHSIYTIYDLVRYRENQLSRLEGITLSDLAKIIACLKRINLHLDTDVLWIEEYKDYYINKKQRT